MNQVMSVSQISVDILKEYVLKVIEKWRKNDLVAEARLAAEDIILNYVDEIPDPKDKEHPYNRFLYVVASDLVSVFGEEQKTFFRQLCRYSRQWHELIAPKMDKSSTTKQLTKTKEPKIEGNDVKEKKKKPSPEGNDVKEKKKKAPPEDLKDNLDEEVDTTMGEDDGEPPLTLEEKRRLFEEGRDAILAEVPDDAKSRFGQIYFAKWGKQVLPVLVMNPYSIPPGAARKLWVDMFDNVSNRTNCPTNVLVRND